MSRIVTAVFAAWIAFALLLLMQAPIAVAAGVGLLAGAVLYFLWTRAGG